MRVRDMLYQQMVSNAHKYGVNPALYDSLINQESRWNPNAVSPVGAQNLTQIMPATGRDPGYGVSPWNGTTEDSLRFGAQYLGTMQNKYGGDTARSLVAYNWGPGNADKWNGDLSTLPAETRSYVQSIMGSTPGARTPTRPTLAQEAAEVDAPGRNSPVTLDQEKKPRAQLHLGLGLSSLGAALSASARGESAAEDLDAVRGRYFQEQEAAAAKAAQEQARIAAINMVGVDTPWGQALAEGADPDMVMADYQQYQQQQHSERLQAQGFGHDYSMAGVNQGYARENQQAGFEHDRGMQESEWDWRDADREDTQGFQWETDTRRYGVEDRRISTEQDFQRGENEADRGVTTRGQDIQKSGQDDEMTRWRVEIAREAAEIERTYATKEAQGTAYRDLLIDQAEAVGDTPTADWLRTQPPTIFDKDSVDFAADTIVGNDVQQGMRATRQYLELKGTDPAAADAFAKSQGWKTDTTSTNTNLSQDTIMNEDGTASIIKGSPTDLEQRRKDAEAAAAASEAAAKGTAQTEQTLAGAKSTVRSLRRAKDLTNNWTTGWKQQLFGGVGGFSPHQLREELSTVKANISFDRLTEMRAASPTGGALGNVTEGELKLLSDTIAAISPTQDDEALLENLNYVEKQYMTILQKIASSDASPEQKREAFAAMGATDEDIGEFTPAEDGMLKAPDGRRYRVR